MSLQDCAARIASFDPREQRLRVVQHILRHFEVRLEGLPLVGPERSHAPPLEVGTIPFIDLEVEPLLKGDPEDRAVPVQPVAAEHGPAADVAQRSKHIDYLIRRHFPDPFTDIGSSSPLLRQSGNPCFILLVAITGLNSSGSNLPPAHSRSLSCSSFSGSVLASRKSA